MKRAYRRYKKAVVLKRRAKNYYNLGWDKGKSWPEFYGEIKSGESCVWMRHTGKICSCWICSQKYERPTAEVVRNIINEQLE